MQACSHLFHSPANAMTNVPGACATSLFSFFKHVSQSYENLQEKRKNLPKVAPMAFGRRIGETGEPSPRLSAIATPCSAASSSHAALGEAAVLDVIALSCWLLSTNASALLEAYLALASIHHSPCGCFLSMTKFPTQEHMRHTMWLQEGLGRLRTQRQKPWTQLSKSLKG